MNVFPLAYCCVSNASGREDVCVEEERGKTIISVHEDIQLGYDRLISSERSVLLFFCL